MSSNKLRKIATEFSYHRRNLPHFEQLGSVYFITFSTLNHLSLSSTSKDIIYDTIQYHNNKKYILHAAVVMDTHVHLVLQPLEESPNNFFSLSGIMHSIKSYSVHEIQRQTYQTGSIWLDENYDRIIRSETDYREKMTYILNNPLKAGLVDQPLNYKWLFVEGCQEDSQAGTPVPPNPPR